MNQQKQVSYAFGPDVSCAHVVEVVASSRGVKVFYPFLLSLCPKDGKTPREYTIEYDRSHGVIEFVEKDGTRHPTKTSCSVNGPNSKSSDKIEDCQLEEP
jgi:hypothetical protein